MSTVVTGGVNGDLKKGVGASTNVTLSGAAAYPVPTVAGSNEVFMYGDATGSILGTAVGGNDTIVGVADTTAGGNGDRLNSLSGDAFNITGKAKGGNDIVFAGDKADVNSAAGDATNNMSSNAIGGNDTLFGGDLAVSNFMYGDAPYMFGKAKGGNDQLTGGDGAFQNNLYGDGYLVQENAVSGNDTLTGGAYTSVDGAYSVTNRLYGDAHDLLGKARGGNDVINGGYGAFGQASVAASGTVPGSASVPGNSLYGDALNMSSRAVGGADTITAGDFSRNLMYGDAASASGSVTGGRDLLISGTGSDTMWGDFGVIAAGSKVTTAQDTFFFQLDTVNGSGQDFIMDFRRSDGDKINLSEFNFGSIADVQMTVTGGNTIINLGNANDVTVVGVTNLVSTDFIF